MSYIKILLSQIIINKEGRRKLLETMSMFMSKTVVMVSQMYTYLKLIKFHTLNINSFIYVNHTSINWLLKNKTYIFLEGAALGLRCCTRAFSSCGERGLPFAVVRGLLIAVASLVVEHGL